MLDSKIERLTKWIPVTIFIIVHRKWIPVIIFQVFRIFFWDQDKGLNEKNCGIKEQSCENVNSIMIGFIFYFCIVYRIEYHKIHKHIIKFIMKKKQL